MEFVQCHCQPGLHVKGTRMMIEDLERLETDVVAEAVLHILGN